MRNPSVRRYGLPLVCLAAVLACLLLPPALFALWDRALLAGPHSQPSAQGLSDAGCDDPTACLLYNCAHLLNVPLGMDTGWGNGWTEAEVTDAGKQQALAALDELRQAGVLAGEAAEALLPGQDARWQASTAPGGLLCLTAETPAGTGEGAGAYLRMVLTPQGRPVQISASWPGAAAETGTAPGVLGAYRTLLGLDAFTDWRTPAGADSGTGAAIYSESAQLYLNASGIYGLTLSAVSMTPQAFEELTAQQG